MWKRQYRNIKDGLFYRTQTYIEEDVLGMGTIIYRAFSWKIARKIWKQHYAQLGDTRVFDIYL